MSQDINRERNVNNSAISLLLFPYLIMPPSRRTSRTRRQFSPVPRVVGYNAALHIEDPEAYTRLDLPLADQRNVVPFGDNPYPTLDEVIISFSFLSSLILFVRLTVESWMFVLEERTMGKYGMIFVSMT